MPDAVVETVPWDLAEVDALRREQQVELRGRYGSGEPGPPPTGRGLVAMVLVRVDGEPSACGAVQDITGEHPDLGAGRTGEIKRVFVRVSARRRGLSRLVMAALHEHARDAGLDRLVLETGMLQPEAIALYEACGYSLIDNYGPYATDPVSLCYAYDLT
ncbi:GNAT family N-acetyltransferase [Sanguibacter antarcticus]|uniref:GNAT family N-acetyltransferase n=1 Tax=Sanguibacter antarcticus TaxID=372484 RepID=UPI000BF35056|nr:GNAT family N-acetyltransferase [Sanguibacter antarcticus]